MTYRLDGAFPSQLQPALLNIYEWASVEWHQFLGLQSRIDSVRWVITQEPETEAGVGKRKPTLDLSRIEIQQPKRRKVLAPIELNQNNIGE
jgi:hypothetical protein